MKVDGKAYRTIWPAEDRRAVEIIDQTRLPHAFVTARLETLEDVVDAISHMLVRGAPLIGAAAAYGVCLALQQDASDACLARARQALLATRPTAVNLPWALEKMRAAVQLLPLEQRPAAACKRAAAICDEDVAINESVGEHGLGLIRNLWESKGKPSRLNILTHCNAGWLATVDWGTALAPVYKAHDAGLPVHVWVDETRPRNQGASLTAWELNHQGVPHTVIVDNAGGHLMQHGLVDICIVGTDRTTATGDVCNKIGTYLKALAARENGVPFYAAVPSPSIDWDLDDGLAQIPIEQRDADEVARVTGRTHSGEVIDVTIIPDGSPVANYAFDVTPARYMTGLITERGICGASREGLEGLFGQGLSVKQA